MSIVDGKAGEGAEFGKRAWKAGKTYIFCCPEAGKVGKKYTLGIKVSKKISLPVFPDL